MSGAVAESVSGAHVHSNSVDTSASQGNSGSEFSTDLLRVYYGRLFPYDSLFNWLSYGNDPTKATTNKAIDKDFISRREWSFTIADDVYIRYLSFADKEEMIAAIQKRQPHKIDIGAVFTHCPKDHNSIKAELFQTVERELVFDIDMTDYDDVRTCCTGANICLRCWPYMTMAIKVIDQALREDFGFQHILWIYSGRRGVHCWVCDPQARQLSNEARSAVVDYLSVHTSGGAESNGGKGAAGGENTDRKIKAVFENPHPMLRRAYATLEPYFEACIADEAGQGLLGRSKEGKKRYMPVLNSLPNESIRRELYERWDRDDTLRGADRWRQLVLATTAPAYDSSAFAQQQHAAKKRRVNYAELEAWRYELVFRHCYARLDANVSKTQNHLLKSAFCVHPKTGRVCVPIDPACADDFNPFAAPTVRSLCAEVDAYDKEHGPSGGAGAASGSPEVEAEAEAEAGQQVQDLDKTSLKQSVDVFNKSFWRPMWSAIHKEFRAKLDKIDAMNVDF